MESQFQYLREINAGKFQANSGLLFDFTRINLDNAVNSRNLQLRMAQSIDEIYRAANHGGYEANLLIDGMSRIAAQYGNTYRFFTSLPDYEVASGAGPVTSPFTVEAAASLGAPFLWFNPNMPGLAPGTQPGMAHVIWLVTHEILHTTGINHAELRSGDTEWLTRMRQIRQELGDTVRDPVTGEIVPNRSPYLFTEIDPRSIVTTTEINNDINQENSGAWTAYYLGGAGELTHTRYDLLDGKVQHRVEFRTSQSPGSDWSSSETHLNAAGATDLVVTHFRDGSRVEDDFGLTAADGFAHRVTRWAANDTSGLPDYQFTRDTWANLSQTNIDYNAQHGTQRYAFVLDRYDANGARDYTFYR